jgi:hypothetical protein
MKSRFPTALGSVSCAQRAFVSRWTNAEAHVQTVYRFRMKFDIQSINRFRMKFDIQSINSNLETLYDEK